MEWYEVSLLDSVLDDRAKGKGPAVLFALEGSEKGLIGGKDNMVWGGRRARTGGTKTCAYEARKAASPCGNIGLIAIWIGCALALEIGVKSWKACPEKS